MAKPLICYEKGEPSVILKVMQNAISAATLSGERVAILRYPDLGPTIALWNWKRTAAAVAGEIGCCIRPFSGTSFVLARKSNG